MGWDRKSLGVVRAPAPLILGRWVLAGGLALVTCVLMFLLYASGSAWQLQGLNIWVLSCSPLIIWLLAFGARAYVYGGALSHQQFLEEQAQIEQQAWQDWAHRYLAVLDSCVLLPDQVSAGVLTQGPVNFPLRTGQARRITALLEQGEPALTGLGLLCSALVQTLVALPAEQELRITLLSDVEAEQHESLLVAWNQYWATTIRNPQPGSVNVMSELSYSWIDEKLKVASAAYELILVVQVHGGALYSDGLAALLLCLDKHAVEQDLPVQGHLLRPMPLDVTKLESELSLFLQTQTDAGLATGMLADGADWRSLTGKLFSVGGAHGASLKVEQHWIQEHLCGPVGPLSPWLVAALGVEVARHQQRSLLVLAQEESRYWISTVTTREQA